MRIVIGISGATGAHLGYRLLEILHEQGHETHVAVSRWGAETLRHETGRQAEDLRALATGLYEDSDLAAGISSGSFPTDGMVIVPCSIKTLAAIATGYSENLIARAADVTLKERRKLVLVTRETPLSSIHLRNMLTLSDLGAVVMPPVLSYYDRLPERELADVFLSRVLSQFGIETPYRRIWGAD